MRIKVTLHKFRVSNHVRIPEKEQVMLGILSSVISGSTRPEIVLPESRNRYIRPFLKSFNFGPGTIRRAIVYDYKKKDFRTLEFDEKVPANGETVITYTVRYTW